MSVEELLHRNLESPVINLEDLFKDRSLFLRCGGRVLFCSFQKQNGLYAVSYSVFTQYGEAMRMIPTGGCIATSSGEAIFGIGNGIREAIRGYLRAQKHTTG